MKQDRFLIAILAGIAVLVVAALVLFFVRNKQVQYVVDDTPQGVVQNYIVALSKGDYERAYGYLADLNGRPDLEKFRQAFISNQLSIADYSMQIGEARIEEEQAFVSVQTVNAGGQSPFEGIYRSSYTVTLVRLSGNWKISNAPFPFWGWDWYQPTPESKTVPSSG